MFTFPTTFFSTADDEEEFSDWSGYDGSDNRTVSTFNNSTATTTTAVKKIDDTHALIVYRGDSNFLYGRIATLDGSGDATYSSETAIVSSAIATYIGLDLLDSTHAAISYTLGGEIYVVIIDFTTSGIGSAGTPVNFNNGTWTEITIAVLSSTEFYLTARESGNGHAYTWYATVSGLTPTEGARTQTYDGTADGIQRLRSCALSSTTALIVLSNVATTRKVQAKLISGTTPTVDNTLEIDSSANTSAFEGIALTRASDTEAVILYGNTDDTNTYAVAVLNTAGTLSKGSRVDIDTTTHFLSGANIRGSIAAIDEENLVFAYENAQVDGLLYTGSISKSGLTLTPNGVQQTPTGLTFRNHDMCAIDNDTVLLAGKETVSTSLGKTYTIKNNT